MKKLLTVQLREQQISPKKARLVMNLIKNATLNDAKDYLLNTDKKAARLAFNLLKSAESAAKDKGFDTGKLVICESVVNEGRRLKRYFIRARGRSTEYTKRSSHLKISLAKIEEGEVKKRKKEIKNG